MSGFVQDSKNDGPQITDTIISEIEADARRHFEKHGRADRLVYLVMGTGRAELATSVGVVEVVGDRNMAADQLARFFRCECTRLFFDISAGKCQTCLLASVTPSNSWLGTPTTTGTPAMTAMVTASNWVDQSLNLQQQMTYIERAALEISTTTQPNQVVRCDIGSTHHAHKCERPRGHAGVNVGRGCSWGADADPMDIEYDGVKLRDVVAAFELLQREHHLVQRDASGYVVRYGKSMPDWFKRQNGKLTSAQRAAISAHWSAQLRAKVAESRARDEAKRPSVVVQLEDDCDW